MVSRTLTKLIAKRLFGGKAIIVYGPRQTGKTTLLHQLLDGLEDVLWLNGDEGMVRTALETVSKESVAPILGKNRILVIDEAQRIEDIGLKLKIIQDGFGHEIQVIATGSSSFDLANKVNEPLTGRKWEYRLLPFSFSELVREHGLIAERSSLPNRLLYGSYPDIVMNPQDARERILLLTRDNLYKDILRLDDIKKPDKLDALLQALALQVGSQVSTNELANTVGLDNKTVDRYLSLLEQSFVIFRLPSFARNLRNELKASKKYFFYDLGIRNALIADFRPVDLRQDIGALFENYVIAELQKKHLLGRQFFWRTSQQQEVDYLSEEDAEMLALEIKWNEKKRAHLPKTFLEAYKPTRTAVVNRENYAGFLLDWQAE